MDCRQANKGKTRLAFWPLRVVLFSAKLLMFSLILVQLVEASPEVSLDFWRNQVTQTRILAESDVPQAYQQIQKLLQTMPMVAGDTERARALNVLARIEVYQGNTKFAEQHISEANNLAIRQRDAEGQVEAILNNALNLVNQGRLAEMRPEILKGLELAQGLNRPDLRGEMMLRASMLYLRFGELETSGKIAVQLMDIAQKDKGLWELLYAHQGLAVVYEQNGRFAESIEHYQAMRVLAQKIPSKLLEAGALIGFAASSYAAKPSVAAARAVEPQVQEAVALYKQVKGPIWLSFGMSNLANNFKYQQRYSEALPLLSEVLRNCRVAGVQICEAYALNFRSDLYSKLADYAAAKADALEAYRIAKQFPLTRLQVDSAQQLADTYAAMHDYKVAYPIARQALLLKEKLRFKQSGDYISQLIESYQDEAKQRKINELTLAAQEQKFKLQQHNLERHRLISWILGLGMVALAAATLSVATRRNNAKLKKVNIDLAESKAQISHQSQILQSILNSMGDGVSVTDKSGKLLFMNPAAEKILGAASNSNLVGGDSSNGQHLFYRPDLKSIYLEEHLPLQKALRGETSDEEELYLQSAGLLGKWLEVTARPVLDNTGELQGGVVVFSDVTQRKSSEDALEFLAHHDTLTGLPNRQLLRDHFHAILDADRSEALIALIFLDLDNFKLINDSLGHGVGDQVLNVLAKRLEKIMSESAMVSREGGDEFLIVMHQLSDVDQVRSMMDRLMTEVRCAIEVGNHTLYVTSCAGISLYPHDGRDFESLRKHADTALYSAKDLGRAHYLFFQKEMDVRANMRMVMQNDLRNALEKEEFVLYFQPQLSSKRDAIIGVEALLRWRKSEQIVPPDAFIPVAEQSGLIVPMGEWVLRESCKQALSWHQKGWMLNLAVNISPIQLSHGGFVDLVRSVLAETAFPANHLELEITESVLLDNSPAVLSILRDLKMMGVRLALDDFGTGYSSLAYLKRISLDSLKIDRSFVRDISEDDEDAVIVKTIIQLGHNMGLSVVAEGVQTKEQRDFLISNHCDYMQGYYFSMPIDFAATTQWLATHWKS